jgi:hypothetical protein
LAKKAANWPAPNAPRWVKLSGSRRSRCADRSPSHPREVTPMNTSPHPTLPHPHPDAPPPTDTGRDSQGRFTKGNAGGPGNPYYRRQAELKRMMLASVTEDDVQSVMQVLVGLARGGDLAAIKLFLEYTVGKPSKEVDPDKEELHEWQLQQQTPRLEQVMEVMANSIETPRANQVAREMVAIVGDCHLKTLGQHLRQGTDYEGNQIAPPLEETPPVPDRNGGKRPSASARRMAAGIPATDQTGDNGGEEARAWNEMREEDLADAVQTGKIDLNQVFLRARGLDPRPDRPVGPGPR